MLRTSSKSSISYSFIHVLPQIISADIKILDQIKIYNSCFLPNYSRHQKRDNFWNRFQKVSRENAWSLCRTQLRFLSEKPATQHPGIKTFSITNTTNKSLLFHSVPSNLHLPHKIHINLFLPFSHGFPSNHF